VTAFATLRTFDLLATSNYPAVIQQQLEKPLLSSKALLAKPLQQQYSNSSHCTAHIISDLTYTGALPSNPAHSAEAHTGTHQS
jgi:hypothetical protein